MLSTHDACNCDFEGADWVSRQVVLCHRVLRTVQAAASESTCLNRETWEAVLKFLLAVNDTLLAPPTVKGMYVYVFSTCKYMNVYNNTWLAYWYIKITRIPDTVYWNNVQLILKKQVNGSCVKCISSVPLHVYIYEKNTCTFIMCNKT